MGYLLVGAAVMHEVTAGMAAGWVVVRPVDHPALVVPFVYPAKGDLVTFTYAVDSGGNVYVMGDKYRVAGGQTYNKSLMAVPLAIIGKESGNHTRFRDRDIASATAKGILNDPGRTCLRRLNRLIHWSCNGYWRRRNMLALGNRRRGGCWRG